MKTMKSVVLCYLFICTVLCELNPNWRLLWSDEFTGTTLDTSKWTARSEPGNNGNKEQQDYLPEQVTVSNGSLILTAIKSSHNGMPYVSGKVDTKDVFSTTYGRYEVRAKVPAGAGLWWPAISLLSQHTCWPQGVEIDIMQFKGDETKAVYGSFHSGSCCGCDHALGSIYNSSTPVSDDYHVFAVEWSGSTVTWYFDNVAYWTTTNTDASPHYLILNLAVGTTPSGLTSLSSSFYIDYVRVYTLKTSCDQANVCSNNGCCFPSNVTCICNPGWTGSSCEYWTGTYNTTFITVDPSSDQFPNGWGNSYSFYMQNNAKIDHGLTLTISNASCPSGCGGLQYSAGAWTSRNDYSYGTFSMVVKTSNVSGTAVSLTAASLTQPTNQISLVITGAKPTSAQLSTTINDTFVYQSDVDLGFDSSLYFHNYSFIYAPGMITFKIDGETKFVSTNGVPTQRLSFGIYYSANPSWYGGSFVFTGNTSVLVSDARWTLTSTPLQCECVTGNAPPVVTHVRNFTTLDSQQDSIVNGWGNGFSFFLSTNTVINKGLSLSLTTCSNCGGANYSSGGWTSLQYYSYGTFTFIAKSTNVSGTALALGAVGTGNGAEQIVFVLGGATPSSISATSWHLGTNYNHGSVALPIDTSQSYHNYTFVFSQTSIKYIVDGTMHFNVTEGVPTGPLAFAIYYSAQPQWYGPFKYTGPSVTNIDSVSYTTVDACPGVHPTTSTTSSITTTSTATTTSATSAASTASTTSTTSATSATTAVSTASTSSSSSATTSISASPTSSSTSPSPTSSSTSTTTSAPPTSSSSSSSSSPSSSSAPSTSTTGDLPSHATLLLPSLLPLLSCALLLAASSIF